MQNPVRSPLFRGCCRFLLNLCCRTQHILTTLTGPLAQHTRSRCNKSMRHGIVLLRKTPLPRCCGYSAPASPPDRFLHTRHHLSAAVHPVVTNRHCDPPLPRLTHGLGPPSPQDPHTYMRHTTALGWPLRRPGKTDSKHTTGRIQAAANP